MHRLRRRRDCTEGQPSRGGSLTTSSCAVIAAPGGRLSETSMRVAVDYGSDLAAADADSPGLNALGPRG